MQLISTCEMVNPQYKYKYNLSIYIYLNERLALACQTYNNGAGYPVGTTLQV